MSAFLTPKSRSPLLLAASTTSLWLCVPGTKKFFSRVRGAHLPANLSGTVALQTAPRLRVQQLLNALLKQERLGTAGGKILAAFQGYTVVKTSHGLKLWDALRKAEKPGVTAQDCAAILNRKAAVLRLA